MSQNEELRQEADVEEEHFSDAVKNDINYNNNASRMCKRCKSERNIDETSEEDASQASRGDLLDERVTHSLHHHTTTVTVCLSFSLLTCILFFNYWNGVLHTKEDMWKKELNDMREKLQLQRTELLGLEQTLQARRLLTVTYLEELQEIRKKLRQQRAEKSEVGQQLQKVNKILSTMQRECVPATAKVQKKLNVYDRKGSDRNDYIERTSSQHQKHTKKNKTDESLVPFDISIITSLCAIVGIIIGALLM